MQLLLANLSGKPSLSYQLQFAKLASIEKERQPGMLSQRCATNLTHASSDAFGHDPFATLPEQRFRAPGLGDGGSSLMQ